jgi:proton-coupled amino acid transporter
MLVKAQETLVDGKLESQDTVQTYAGLTGAALGPAGDILCKVLNVVTCFGITVGYLIFIASTAQSMLPAAMAATTTTAQLVGFVTPPMLGLAWMRSLKGVNLISLMGRGLHSSTFQLNLCRS